MTEDHYLLFLPANASNHLRVHVNQKNQEDLKNHISKILGGGSIVNLQVTETNCGHVAFCSLQHSSKPRNSLALKFLNPYVPVLGNVVVVGKKEDGVSLRTLSDMNGECDFI